MSVAKAIDSLPPFVAKTTGAKIVASTHLVLPQPRLVGASPKTRFLTQATSAGQGLVLDYVILNSSTNNFTFRGDMTYYISGSVTIQGSDSTNTFEGGTVIKFARNTGIWLNLSSSNMNWEGSEYRPIILTAVDDNSVGETITNSTGIPTNYYANIALALTGPDSVVLQYVRIAYANSAIQVFNRPLTVKDSQFVNVGSYGIKSTSCDVSLENVLMHNVSGQALWLYGAGKQCLAQNLTVHNAGTFLFLDGPSFCVTNSLLIATNLGSAFSGAYNYTSNSDAGIFQTVGAGANYLAVNCPAGIRNAGTTNIDPVLLAELRTTTTYAPNTSFVGQTISTSTTLTPLGLADTNTPDLGYHYPVLDYLFSQCRVDGAAGGLLTFNPGTAVGWYGQGFTLTNSTEINFGVVLI